MGGQHVIDDDDVIESIFIEFLFNNILRRSAIAQIKKQAAK